MNSSICEIVNLWICEFVNLWVREFVNSWICEFVNLWIGKFVNSWICEFVKVYLFDLNREHWTDFFPKISHLYFHWFYNKSGKICSKHLFFQAKKIWNNYFIFSCKQGIHSKVGIFKKYKTLDTPDVSKYFLRSILGKKKIYPSGTTNFRE